MHGNNVKYFASFGVEYISKETRKFKDRKLLKEIFV